VHDRGGEVPRKPVSTEDCALPVVRDAAVSGTLVEFVEAADYPNSQRHAPKRPDSTQSPLPHNPEVQVMDRSGVAAGAAHWTAGPHPPRQLDQLLDASVVGGAQAARASIWDGEIPAPVVPSEA
jgi:hypothetical protein